MCGIAGFVQRDRAGGGALAIGRKQLAVLRHRGPDSEEAVAIGAAVLGQTRLAIIDLQTGDPPITNEAGDVAVAFNGEIYNFQPLRALLRRLGHSFRTQGDTEVVAHLSEEFEPVELARRLDGMFAIAVWDGPRQRLTLCRDRFGKKPLFWWYRDGVLVFASEIKALFVHPQVLREFNEDALVPYLTFGYAPSPTTFYEGVQSLEPGHVLTMTVGSAPVVREYWRPPLPTYNGNSFRVPTVAEAVRDTRALVTEAVERRLIADVPLGAFLSGGVDSSIVVGTMSALSSKPVKTFTVGFDEGSGLDERPYARLVAKHFNTEHVEFVVQPNAIELVEELLWHHDQPFGDSSAIPTYLLSKCTREHVTVALAGDGGDELFAGYERFAAGLAFANYLALPGRLRRKVARAADRLPATMGGRAVERLRRLLSNGDEDLLQTFANWVAYIPQPVRATMIGAQREANGSLSAYRSVWNESAGQDVLTRLLDLNARTYLPDDLLVKMDRMSMAHGLEVRSPFLDHRVAEYVFRLPGSMKIRHLRLKYLLRRAFADDLPRAILTRPKQGFAVPLDRWFRNELRDYARSLLGSGARVRGHLDPTAIDGLLQAHDAGTRNYGHGIWALLTLELFLRREGW